MTVRFAQEAAPAATRALTLGPVTIIARDVARLTEFYTHGLGLEASEHGPSGRVLGASGTPIVEFVDAPHAKPRESSTPGLFHLAIVLPSRVALGAWLGHALRVGLALEGASDHGVSEAVYLSDPEGNGIEVYRDRASSEWPLGQDGHVAMVTEPLDVEGVLAAGAEEAFSKAPTGARLGHIHLQVSSLAAARDFYVDVLGLKIRQDDYRGALFMAADGYHHHIAVNVWRSLGRTPTSFGVAAGLTEIALHLGTDEALVALKARLLAARWPFDADNGAIRLADPDGIRFRVATSALAS